MDDRQESDSMGQVTLPAWAYWGASTQRAVDNFRVSQFRLPPAMIRAVVLIKKHVALANQKLGVLDEKLANAIVRACDEILAGKFDQHFPVDLFQTGSGTSSNMNANEVIANRANELLGSPLGAKKPVHPNDHVNLGQSSNDVIPSSVQVSVRCEVEALLKNLALLEASLAAKETEFANVIKLGRTHLQDAVPMTLGQEFSAWKVQISKASARIRTTLSDLEELPLGGTAIGTGLNAAPGMAEIAVGGISSETGHPFRVARNRFEQIASRDSQVMFQGALTVLATSLMRIADDLRLLASGPRAGLGEIELPGLQPGSSIMPGKVNPVIPEMVLQVGLHVSAKIVAVSQASRLGPLELNMANPLIAHECLSSIELLSNAARSLAVQCVDGIVADEQRCRDWIDWSMALVTPLNAVIGYDKAAKIAHKAHKSGKKVRDVLIEEGELSETEISAALDPLSMLGEQTVSERKNKE